MFVLSPRNGVRADPSGMRPAWHAPKRKSGGAPCENVEVIPRLPQTRGVLWLGKQAPTAYDRKYRHAPVGLSRRGGKPSPDTWGILGLDGRRVFWGGDPAPG